MITKAKLSAVNNKIGVGEIESHGEDRGKVQSDVALPQPYAGRGWGIRAGIETDSVVFADNSKILGYLTDSKFFRDAAEVDQRETFKNQPQYKDLSEGEIALQSKENSLVFLDQNGNVSLSTSDGSLIEVNKQTDSINFLSVNQAIRTEAAYIRNGIVKRDLRTEEEKASDIFLSSLLVNNFEDQNTLDFVGADSQYTVADVGGPLIGVFDPDQGIPSITRIPGIKGTPNAEKITQDIVNPALTEYRIEVNEFADGISSLNTATDPKELAKGRLTPNLAGQLVLGTVVDENGRMPRFDYVFSKPKAHGDLWKLPAVNDSQISTDFKVDLLTSIKDPANLGSTSQWISSGIDRFNTGQMFQLVLNTRGADNQGEIPSSNQVGSRWALHVDKEGLTKWNIPAATSLSNLENFRAGRSLLWNTDGSITQSIGVENTGDLETISDISLLKTRVGRSYTVDYEGSVEKRLGKDRFGQSEIKQADGGLRFKYGKLESPEAPFTNTSDITGVKAPSKAGRLVGTSISGELEGGVDLAIGTDSAGQSISLAANGMIRLAVGEDSAKDSFVLDSSGNIKMKVASGGHKFEMHSYSSTETFRDGILIQHGGPSGSLMQIDENGVITLRNSAMNANVMISETGTINLINRGGKISLAPDGSVGIGGPTAGIDISPTSGVTLRTPGGSISLNPAGKVEVAANTGFAVTGPFAHLNTTATALSPSAPTSPFTVAAAGGGLSIDPFTGDSASGFPTIKG